MPQYSLHCLDKLHDRFYLDESDQCCYFMEKKSEGYNKSDANNIIYNFKKPMDRKGFPEWRYKQQAIGTLSRLLCGLKFEKGCVIIPAPTSKPRGNKDWDDRLDQTVDALQLTNPNIIVSKCLDTINAQSPAHLGGTRDITAIKANTSICTHPTFPNDTKYIFIVDDVLTTGAHFKAWKELLMERYPDATVIGIFFALHVWDSDIFAL